MKYRYFRYSIAVAAALMAVPFAGAQGSADNDFYSTPFYGLVKQIATDNSVTMAAHSRAVAETENARAANALENPEIEFERLWSAGPADNKWNAGISQSFDWPGAYRVRSRAADKIELAQREGLRTTYRELTQKSGELALNIIAANRRIALLEEMHATMTCLREKYERAWELGETTILDLNKIKIEEIRSASELEQARIERSQLAAELSAICPESEAVNEILSMTDFPYLAPLRERAHYLGNAVDNSPEVRYAAAMAAAEAENMKVASMERYPGFSVGYVHAFEEGTHFNGLSIGVSLPVWSRRHSVNSARYLAEAARFETSIVRIELETKAAADYDSAVKLHRQMEQYAPLVEGVNNLALLRKALDGGEMSLLDYLQETNYFLAARADYLTLTRDYLLANLRLTLLDFPAD
ncbi:MAG: TolC family protein [Bacteroidales bacterium]|nr:TolC family protein [Bacteroidales bacterium]